MFIFYILYININNITLCKISSFLYFCLRFLCLLCFGCKMLVLCFSKRFVLDLQSIDFQVDTKFIVGGGGVNSTKLPCGANTYF